MQLETIVNIDEMLALRAQWALLQLKVAFVPTMGALHAGHLSLVDQARRLADRVVVSIFVNPTQFGPNEDFSKYPRTLQQYLQALAGKADAAFLPTAAGIYPDGYQTYVINKKMSDGLCGASRLNHFEGVLTVVLKLFNIVQPNFALFGKKDYQQWRLIETMVKDFNLSLQVLGCETFREADGLAMSSRNRYLSPAERQIATHISEGLVQVKNLVVSGEKEIKVLIEQFKLVALRESAIHLEYVEIRKCQDLSLIEATIEDPAVMLIAARVGTTRLIDNIELD